MDLKAFAEQLERCGQSPDEVPRFIEDFARVRLKYISRQLAALDSTAGAGLSPAPETMRDWQAPDGLRESGVDPAWIAGTTDPGNLYLHARTAIDGDWFHVAHYLAMAFLSDKQARVLFPLLSRRRRQRTIRGLAIPRAEFAAEVQRLNRLLHWAAAMGLEPKSFARYKAHLRIHGASQNLVARVGSAGAILAIVDAISELGGEIASSCGPLIPATARTPVELADYLFEQRGELPRAILLTNGRAVVFSSNPDVVVFHPLGTRYNSANDALAAWEAIRHDVMDRGRKVHVFVEGEVNTATDLQNLHERLALGSRSTRTEIRSHRFLMMAILTPELLVSGVPGRSVRGRKSRGDWLANRTVERFSDVFNLYFAWGYDSARTRHPKHWEVFKDRMSQWCLE
jgi:hypothetical protein